MELDDSQTARTAFVSNEPNALIESGTDVYSCSSSTDTLQDYNASLSEERSLKYILILTSILGSLQMAWSIEFSQCTPFLLSLNISKPLLSLIWIAGPLSGCIGQPLVGLWSANCNLRYGRRRPFIIASWIIIVLLLIFLANCFDIVKSVTTTNVKSKTIPFAVVAIYLLDFSISAFQATSRALIIDMVPNDQQSLSNAWAARMIGGFNILGFFLASLNLSIWPFKNSENDEYSQFKNFTLICIMIFSFFTLFGCYYIQERNPQTDPLIITERQRIQEELQKNSGNNTPLLSDSKSNKFLKMANALFNEIYYNLGKLSLQTKLVNYVEFMAWVGYFPMLFYTTTYVGELYISQAVKGIDTPLTERQKINLTNKSTRIGSTALLVNSLASLLTNLILPVFTGEKKYHIFKYQINWKNCWIFSHAVFILCMFSTFFITSYKFALVMFGILGFVWGSALWIPFVLIAKESIRIKMKKIKYQETHSQVYLKYLHLQHEPGIILGIHNFFVSSPQMISSLISSVLFKFLCIPPNEKEFGQFDDSIGWIFRFGGLMCVGAWMLSFRIKTQEEFEIEDQMEQ